MFKVCAQQLRYMFVNIRFYVSMLIGITMHIVCIMPLVEFADSMGSKLNIVELFTYFNCDVFTYAAALLGFFLLVSDIPFAAYDEIYILMRQNKRKWLIGKIMFLFIASLLYYMVIIVAGILYAMGTVCLDNGWSDALKTLETDNSGIYASVFSVSFPYSHILSGFTPFQAFSISFVLSVLYSFSMSLLLFLLNLIWPRVIGYFATILIHCLGYAMVAVLSVNKLAKFSLFGNSALMYHSVGSYYTDGRFLSVQGSICMFSIFIAVTICTLCQVVKKHNFDFMVNGNDAKSL